MRNIYDIYALDAERMDKILKKLSPEEGAYLLEMIEKDPLTSVYNRRVFNKDLSVAMSEADRKKENFSLVMVDVDGFKKYNDTRGLRFGDGLLEELSLSLRLEERKIYRYGGDEFAAIINNTSLEQAVIVASRIKDKAEADLKPNYGLTLSIGISNYKMTADNSEDVISQASRALQTAKKRGKNQIVAYNPE